MRDLWVRVLLVHVVAGSAHGLKIGRAVIAAPGERDNVINGERGCRERRAACETGPAITVEDMFAEPFGKAARFILQTEILLEAAFADIHHGFLAQVLLALDAGNLMPVGRADDAAICGGIEVSAIAAGIHVTILAMTMNRHGR